ncbi:Hint domain-containing protein [Chitinophaga sp. 30R24]|uniref:Hint domain-containing protein n=1 Tax=Chitinophaga sp. 30R24 TaxID=3248838 RepID=UPI003B9195A3
MRSLPNLTAQQTDQLIVFHQSSIQEKTMYLDPKDAVHRNYITTMLEAAGRSRQDYPHLYKALETFTSFNVHPDTDRVHLVDAGKTDAGKATATIWSRSSSDTMVKGGCIMLFDADTNTMLAQGDNTAVRSGFIMCPTRSTTAAPAGKNLTILFLGHATDTDGATRFFSFTSSRAVSDAKININITAPIAVYPTHTTDIKIAVGRDRPHQTLGDADYVYVEDTDYTNPHLIVPFTGSADLNGTVDLGSLNISNLTTSIFISNTGGSTSELNRASDISTDQKMVDAFSVGAQSNNLRWNYPYDQLGYQHTNSIVYDTTSIGDQIDSYFYFSFNIPLKEGYYAIFSVCSEGKIPEAQSNNCQTIPNLYFWWHCVAKGTLITLEDGSKKPAETLNETYRVKTGTNGSSLAVSATVQGQHSADPAKGEIYQLTTANGKNLISTGSHMIFMTANKCRALSDLIAGDSIVTEEGISTVATIEAISYDDMFYGLVLGNTEEQADENFPHNMANYYANGILCGDQQTMRYNTVAAYEDLDYMLPRIKPELHQDYTSALRDKRS